MMKLLADTHVVVWWFAADARLSPLYKTLLMTAQNKGPPVAVSAISLWEIAMLVSRDRIALGIPVEAYLARIEESRTFSILPLDGATAVDATRLGESFPRDPADRLIAATARRYGLSLMTADDRIRDARVVPIA